MAAKSSKSSEAVLIKFANLSTLSAEFEVPIDQIRMRPEDFRHREESDLDAEKESMKILKDSLQSEGLLEPLLVYRDESGSFVQVTGHRRRAAIEQLADANVGNFKRNMPVKVKEILGGNHHDHAMISAMDNFVREQVTEFYRIHSVVTFIQMGMDHLRIKAGMGIPDPTFARCCRLAANPWMMQHILRNEVTLTNAHLLLEAAGGKGGEDALENLRKDLIREVAEVKAAILIKGADLAARDKELSKAEAQVKNYFPAHVNKAWVAALKRGEPIKGKDKVKFRYPATIEKTKTGKRLSIPAVTLVIAEPNLEQLVEVTLQLDRVLKTLKPEVNALARQKASLLESGEDEDEPADFSSCGLDAVAALYGHRTNHIDPTVDELLAQLGPDDVDPMDREQTMDEINRNYDREEAARTVTPATAGLEVQPTQPPDADAD